MEQVNGSETLTCSLCSGPVMLVCSQLLVDGVVAGAWGLMHGVDLSVPV
jgi:hypothetical protein